MAIRYIFGRAGKGKTARVYQEIKEALQKDEEHKLILIVPEQFTLESERDLIEKLGLPGIMRVEVLSFTRLVYYVFNEVGGLTRTPINEQGRHMVLRRIIDEAGKDLTIYKKAAKQDGFVQRFSELLCQLKTHDILPTDLNQQISEMEEGGIVRQKLQDISTIYERFNQYLQGRYIDTDDYINLFTQKADQAAFLKDAQVWIDGFATFTPQTMKIIEKIMMLARDTTITFTIDFAGDGADSELFTVSQLAYNKVHEIVQRNGLQEERVTVKGESVDQYKSKEILHVEKMLFAYPYRSFADDVRDIHIFAAQNINSEIEGAAAQVRALARERNWRWRDIAVVCNDLETYGSIIKRVFTEYEVPFFLDQKRDIMNNPIIELILSTLEILQRDYRYDDVFRFLKTGFGGLDLDQVERLENYVLQYGICGSKWKQPFHLGDEAQLEELNLCREKFILPMEKLARKVRGKKSFAEFTKALYDYLEDIGVREKLADWIEELRRQRLYDAVNENTQIWNIVMEIFDQMVEILGDQKAGIKEYKRVLESGFLSFEVGIIPPTVDQVLVGNIQRSKSHDIKALFVIGVNDGVIPSGKEDEGMLSEEEKVLLKERGIDLGSDRKIRSDEERFLIYSALTKPTRYLWMSYALADGEGKAMRPSILIDRFCKLFKGLTVKDDMLLGKGKNIEAVSARSSTFKYLIENLRSHLDGEGMDELWWDVYGWYFGQEKWKNLRDSVVEGFFHQNQVTYIGREKAKLLYRLPIRSSVSRLEQFVRCPFAHFVRYGLRPYERKTFEVGAPDIGEFFHNCLLSFAKKLSEEKLNWHRLEREQCEKIIEGIIDELVPGHGNGVLLSTHRYKYLVNRLKRISKRAVWTLADHLKRGDFQPLGHEISFGEGRRFPAIEVELDDGEKILLEGRIDRVDLFTGEDGTYVKVIDYKSGDKEFSLSDVYYGLSLQLMIYLRAVLESRDKQEDVLKPAGIFYFKIDDPLIKSDAKVIEAVEKQIGKELRMKGLVLKDVNIVRRMDRDLEGSSDILPVSINKDETLSKTSSALEEEELNALLQHVEGLLKEIGREILQGNIKIEPVKSEGKTACSFCPYKAICQFDSLLEDNGYRHYRKLDNGEVIARITKGGEVRVDA
jgi:ATP-dependent helicase/nuclease subunit B